ncbi:hypothetical protein GH714_010074 [Hevea brasiliensis]|uniref:F-box domain-containing protein n=1 Tax=Hevea brasiliensis TaxID=3981 RepID=A0A6A6MJ14_HEVBR|nr:hypothetical protein GH714_010074 [Hevea brasiliensis]
MENKRCKCLAGSRKWANMNYDILVKIFMMPSTMDLVSSISLVCPSWRAECCHPMLCHTLDLARLNYSVDNPRDLCASLDNWPRLSLAQALDSALILSGTNVMRLIFHLRAHITDERLIFAAERCPMLKRLVLPAWNHTSANGFCAAIQKLEELSLLMDFNPSEGPTIFKCESDKSIAEQASKLKTIFWCQTESCIMCQRVHNDLGRPKWNEYEEGLGEKTRKVLLQFDQKASSFVVWLTGN